MASREDWMGTRSTRSEISWAEIVWVRGERRRARDEEINIFLRERE